ncbi:hypothetical protein [Ureibacillus sp. FSL K6-0165]|uniref:hypothetical protein n=1 Tax=Ureibacillus sp. FSL K6-0165 TaxID=2954606 RepID=UPI0030F9D4C5
MNSPFQSSISTITNRRIIFDFAVGKDAIEEHLNTRKTKRFKAAIQNKRCDKLVPKRYVNLSKLSEKCLLVKALEEGNECLYHDEITHLAMNLIHVEGSEKKFIHDLQKNSNHVEYGKVESFKYYCQNF